VVERHEPLGMVRAVFGSNKKGKQMILFRGTDTNTIFTIYFRTRGQLLPKSCNYEKI
jgi:hypothetical protein